MKKTFTILSALALAVASQAQLAKKYVFFEHFTQASCGPCAAQNPGFQSSILDYYNANVHHVAYHTSWPGTDPMNFHNKPQVQSRVDYYGVNGVPNIQMDGADQGGPSTVTREMVNQAIAEGSPISVAVTQTVVNDTVFDVTVTIKTVGTKPSGNYNLLLSLVEREVIYTSPPGTNGEKDFPNVFRRMLTADDGDAITLPDQGESISFNYTYTRSTVWKMENIYSLAAVQNTDDKSVINSGSSIDPNGFLFDPIKFVDLGVVGNNNTFDLNVKNTGSGAENFKFSISSDAPGDWSGSLTVNGTTITEGTTINIPGGTEYVATLTVSPGATPAIGAYTIEMSSADNPSAVVQTKKVQVISGIRDLVINHNAGAGSKNTADFNAFYLKGLVNAGNTVHAAANSDFLTQAFSASILTGVKSIYYNVGWSIGSLNPTMLANLKSFIDNGGNLFIAGQDIAWEYCENTTSPPSPYYNEDVKNFINQYLHAGYVKDDAGSTSFIANPTEYFSATGTSSISSSFYGSGNHYPDQLTAINGGIPVFYYNTAKTNIAGVRYAKNSVDGKTVYLGIGPEQLSSAAKREQVIQLAHDYFYATNVGVKETANSTGSILGDCYPNPVSKDFVTFTFGDLKKDMTLKVVDVTGKTVYTQPVWAEFTSVKVNVSNFNSGIYFYQLLDENQVVATKKLTVAK